MGWRMLHFVWENAQGGRSMRRDRLWNRSFNNDAKQSTRNTSHVGPSEACVKKLNIGINNCIIQSAGSFWACACSHERLLTSAVRPRVKCLGMFWWLVTWWRGASADSGHFRSSASASPLTERLRQRPLPHSDAINCLRLPSCRSLPVRWQHSVVWILSSLRRQSVRASVFVLPSASCKAVSLWSRSSHPSAWTGSLLCQAN